MKKTKEVKQRKNYVAPVVKGGKTEVSMGRCCAGC